MPKRSASVAEDTRQSLIDAGRKLFSERGFSNAPTAEIAARAGVTEGAFFHHFSSKKALFSAVFESLERDLAERALDASRGKPPLDAFLAGCSVYLEFAERSDFSRIVMIEAPVILGPEGWRERDSALGVPAIEAGLKALMSAGIIARQPPRALAVLVLGALNEAGLALARKEEGLSARACIKALRNLIAPGA